MSAEDAAEVLATVVERLETVTGTVITAAVPPTVLLLALMPIETPSLFGTGVVPSAARPISSVPT